MNKEKLILDTIKEKAYGVNAMQHPVYGHGQYDMAYEILDEVQKIIQSEPDETCTYTRDEETNAWECSECGLTWVFMEDYTTPEENDMYYCPKCGRKIKIGE